MSEEQRCASGNPSGPGGLRAGSTPMVLLAPQVELLIVVGRALRACFAPATRLTRIDQTFPSQRRKARSAALGSFSTIRSRAAAGPVGWRRACSQFCNVFTLTPSRRAKSPCERWVRSRIARTRESENLNTREGLRSPRRISPAWLTLVSSSPKSFLSTIPTPPLKHAEEL